MKIPSLHKTLETITDIKSFISEVKREELSQWEKEISYEKEQTIYITNKLTNLISQIKPITPIIITVRVGMMYKPHQKRTMTVAVNLGKYLDFYINEDKVSVARPMLSNNISEDDFNQFMFLNNFKISEFKIIADEIFIFAQEINKNYKSDVFCFALTTEARGKNE